MLHRTQLRYDCILRNNHIRNHWKCILRHGNIICKGSFSQFDIGCRKICLLFALFVFLKLNMLCGKSCLVLPNVRGINYLFGKAKCCNDRRNFVFLPTECHNIIYIPGYSQFSFFSSQRSLHNAPIFRLFIKGCREWGASM